MRKILFTLFFSMTLILTSGGCLHEGLLEGAVSDVSGWNVSACVSGFSTCWDLFWDNSDKFEDGFISAIDGLGPKT